MASPHDIRLPERVRVVEVRIDRMVSDIESEKGTRARANERLSNQIEALDKRLTRHDRLIWMAAGVLAALNIATVVLTALSYFKKA